MVCLKDFRTRLEFDLLLYALLHGVLLREVLARANDRIPSANWASDKELDIGCRNVHT